MSLFTPPTATYELLYVSSHRYPGTHTHPQPARPDKDTPKDLYQTVLVFAAALAIAPRYNSHDVKVALLGDAVLAVAPNFSMIAPEPPHSTRPTIDQMVADLNALQKSVDIWY